MARPRTPGNTQRRTALRALEPGAAGTERSSRRAGRVGRVTVRTRAVVWVLVGCALSLVSTTADPWVYRHIVWARVYETDWGRALRMMGYWPTWIIVSIALWRDGRPPIVAAWRGRLLALAVTAAGLGDELLKLLIRRERPNAHDGISVFRPFTDRPFSTSGLSTPSSHAVLAFAAAATLARLFPRSAWMWYLLAAGCAVTRLLASAHFFSDVVSGALVGVATAYVVAALTPSPHAGRAEPRGSEAATSGFAQAG